MRCANIIEDEKSVQRTADPMPQNENEVNLILLACGTRGVLPIPKRDRNKFGTETHIVRGRDRLKSRH